MLPVLQPGKVTSATPAFCNGEQYSWKFTFKLEQQCTLAAAWLPGHVVPPKWAYNASTRYPIVGMRTRSKVV